MCWRLNGQKMTYYFYENDLFYPCDAHKIDPVIHFIWCEKMVVKCCILYHDDIPVSVTAIIDNNDG